jgi:CheY-like chemotaxis protein
MAVLIVEDDAVIRILVAEMLEELGYVVAGQAARVDEAVALVNSGLAFDAAILDVNLDGMTAEPIAVAIEKRGLPFVFATGYGATGIPRRYRGRPVLQKPFAIEQLSDALKQFAGG